MSLRIKNALLNEPRRKNLYVKVLEAKNLGLKKSSAKSAFFVISCNNVHFRSNESKNNSKIEWNQTFSFKEPESDCEIRVILFLVDKNQKDIKIGEIKFNVSSLRENIPTKSWYCLNSTENSNKSKARILVESLLITENVTVSKNKHINDFFKRKMSWGGKRGSIIVERDSPPIIEKNDSIQNVDDFISKDELEESVEKAFEQYQPESSKVITSQSIDNEKTDTQVVETDDNDDVSVTKKDPVDTQEIHDVSKKDTDNNELIKIQPSTPVKNKRGSSKKTPKKQSNDFVYSDSIVSTPSSDSVKKKKSFFQILGFKKKPSSSSHDIFTLNECSTSNLEIKEYTKTRKQSIHIEELYYYNGFITTLKDYIHKVKIFFRNMKRLDSDFINLGCKKGIQEFSKLSEYLSLFLNKYKSHFSNAEKSYKDENWNYGKYFYDLYCQIEDPIQYYRISQVQLSFNLERESGPPSRLELFLLLNDKHKKDLLSFEDLLLLPFHHINSLCHITKRLYSITPPDHSEYDLILRSYKSFDNLIYILSSIKDKENADYEEMRHIQDSIEFTLNIPYFNLVNGQRSLIYRGDFLLLHEKDVYLNIHAFLFDDILIFCKNVDNNVQESNEDPSKYTETDSDINNTFTNKKYSILAVLNIEKLFIVDPLKGISNIDDEPLRNQVETRLEIIDIGVCIHRVSFDSISSKRLWMDNLKFAISKVVPAYQVFDIPKLYKSLLSDSNQQLDDISEIWPYHLSLRAIHNQEYTAPYFNRNDNDRIVWQEIVQLKENMISKFEELEEKLLSIGNSTCSNNDGSIKIDNKSIPHDDLQEELEKERKARAKAELKVKELSDQIELLNIEMKKRDEEYSARFKQLEQELINQREQHSNDIERILNLLQINMTHNKAANISNPIRSRPSSKKQMDYSSASPSLSHSDIKTGEESTESSKGDSNQQASTYNNIRSSQQSHHKVKGRILKQKKFTEEKTKKRKSDLKSKEKSSPWRRRPTIDSDLNIRKSKKVDWSYVKGEDFFSDHFAYDQDEFNNQKYPHSDYPRTENMNAREYSSDYFSEDDISTKKYKLKI